MRKEDNTKAFSFGYIGLLIGLAIGLIMGM